MQIAASIGVRAQDEALISVAGDGDTVAFLHEHALEHHFTYTSLAGGAFLQWLAGDPLPGIEALLQTK